MNYRATKRLNRIVNQRLDDLEDCLELRHDEETVTEVSNLAHDLLIEDEQLTTLVSALSDVRDVSNARGGTGVFAHHVENASSDLLDAVTQRTEEVVDEALCEAFCEHTETEPLAADGGVDVRICEHRDCEEPPNHTEAVALVWLPGWNGNGIEVPVCEEHLEADPNAEVIRRLDAPDLDEEVGR